MKGDVHNVRIQPKINARDEFSPLTFDVKATSSSTDSPGPHLYDCSYQSHGKTAKFRIELSIGPMADNPAVASGEGKFIAVRGSDNSGLLLDLKVKLDATSVPDTSERVDELPFDANVLGTKDSRSSDDSFSPNPPGDWITTKIFLPKGGDEGEAFLNLNPVLGKGEFSMKDSDYGNYILQEFAKVL